jgi:hypothetical protein
MKYDFITIVSICGDHDGFIAIPSILRSSKALPGSKGLLLSISRPESLPEGITWRKIPPLNRQQYQLFSIYFLASFIETDFALIVQADGWAFNQGAWTDDFLEYDYIGAPNEGGLIKPKTDDDPGFRWDGMLVRGDWEWMKEENQIMVLNSGFNLRSKKFLHMPRDIGLPYVFDDNPVRQNDDIQLCIFMRSKLIDAGIKFAPIEIAKIFAFEFFPPNVGPIDFNSIFGLHCSHMRLTESNQIFIGNQFHPFSRKFLLPILQDMGYELTFE